jgi:uncharacterized protein YqfA (UPF0365 family)
MGSLVGMYFRQVRSQVIVNAKIMAAQAGLDINRRTGISTQRLEAHYLAEGNVMNVINAIIAAQRAGIDLDFDRAAAIDLAGRDVLEAVKTSVHPRVIDCPDQRHGSSFLSAIAMNGIELKVKARVTVRTNLDQLIGGATEETVIARVGESIISSIGSSENHFLVLENPNLITRTVLKRGLDNQTAFPNRFNRHCTHRGWAKYWCSTPCGPSGSRRSYGSSSSGTASRRSNRSRASYEGQGRRKQSQPRSCRSGSSQAMAQAFIDGNFQAV